MPTNRDILDTDLRAIMANELLILRKMKKRGLSDEYLLGLRVGFMTALRRVQFQRNKDGER